MCIRDRAYEVPKDFSNGALKESFLARLKDLFGVSVFIESGTFLGNTTFAAVSYTHLTLPTSDLV